MANEKIIQSRIQHKHDIETNWNKATGFIPKRGEIIVYDIDDNYSYERFKIGDGVTNVINLPFADETKQDKLTGVKGQIVVFDSNGNAIAKDMIQADWNQSDETAVDYIKNKPFGKNDTWTTIDIKLSGTSLDVLKATDVTDGLYKTGLYRFTVNDTDVYTYEKTVEGDDRGYLIGDGGFSILPFAIRSINYPSDVYFSRQLVYRTPISSLKIEYFTGSIKQLDEEYISDAIARVEYVDNQINNHQHSWNDINEDRPFYEDIIVNSNYGKKTLNNDTKKQAWTFAGMTLETYRITIDGVSYIVTGGMALGDSNFKKYPFYYSYPYFTFNDSNNHTVQVESVTIDLKKLDDKFISDTFAKKSELFEDKLIQIDFDEGSESAISLFSKVKKYLQAGKTVVVNYKHGEMIDQVFPTITEDGEGMYMTIPFADGVRTIGVNSGSSNAGNHYYESKGYKLIDSSQELTEEEKINYYPSIKVLEDVAENIKNDLLNGAGEAYDTLKELGDLIDINSDALNVLNTVAIGKQDKIKGTEGQTVGFDENGNAVAKDMIQADWNQSDETAVDYIKNKEAITSRIESLESFHANFVAVSSDDIQALFI